MNNDIITQNVKLIDEKIIIKKVTFEMINNIKYRVYEVSRSFEPVVCNRCGCLVFKIKDYYVRKVKTFINYDYPVLLKYRQRRLICDCGKTIHEYNSIVGKKRNISNYLKMEILKLCKEKMSFTTIAKQLNVSPTTVINVFMEHCDFDRKELTEILCVDEFSAKINDDNPYACIIGDPISRSIIDILPSRHQSYLEYYLSKIPQEERLKVKIVNIDMWIAYKMVFKTYCWNAKIAVDPFHWIKHATDNFHKLRRKIEEKNPSPKIKSILRNHWKLFGLKESKLKERKYFSKLLNQTITQRELVEYGVNSDSRLETAWILLQKIYKFRDECDYNNAGKVLYEIIKELKSSKIDELIETAKTYNSWYEEIINSFILIEKDRKCSNAFIEGTNRLVKEIKAFSCGFNNFWVFRNRILYIQEKNTVNFSINKNRNKLYAKKRKKSKR